MRSALRNVTANDNLPPLPIPAETVSVEAVAPVEVAPSGDEAAREGFLALLLVWTLALGACVGLAPGGLAFAPVAALLGAAAFGMVGVARKSERALIAAGVAWSLGAYLAASGAVTAFAALACPVLFASLWIVLAGACMRIVADAAAGVLGVGLGAAATGAAVVGLGPEVGLALGAVFGFLYLGLARGAVKQDLPTSGGHYLAAWVAATAGAVLLAVAGGAQAASPEAVVVGGSLALAAVIVWSAQGVWPALQAGTVAMIAGLLIVPGLEARVTDGSQMVFPGQPLGQLLVFAAVAAAGAAMCVRGVRAGRMVTGALGVAAFVASVNYGLSGTMMNVENAVVLGVAAVAMFAGLLAARMS